MRKVGMQSLTRRQAMGVLGALSISGASNANEPGFPSKSVRYILPFSAGSSTDFLSRTIAEQLTKQLNQPVVVENKPGAAGVIGTQMLAKAPPDGYTIGLVSLASMAMVPPTLKPSPYDSVADFEPLSALVSTDMLLVASPKAQGANLKDFVGWARGQKQPPFLATLGAGTSGHFIGFLFGQAAKIKFEPVHFRTFGDLIPAMLSGSVDVMVVAPAQVLPFIKEGKLRALALNGPSRLASLPDVPTFAEEGFTDMQFVNWIGIAAPAKTPAETLDKLNAEIVKAIKVPGIRSKLEDTGLRIIASSRQDFANTIKRDVAIWQNMVKTTGFVV